MTAPKQTAARNPTAKELAEEALERADEARTTAQTVLTEVRELRQAGGVVAGSGTDSNIIERLDNLDKDIEGLLENLNTLANASNAAPIGPDGKPLDLSTVVAEMRKAFTTHATTIDAHHKEARGAVASLQDSLKKVADQLAGYNDQPPGGHSMAALEQDLHMMNERIGLLADKVREFDEAGLTPATGEDVSSLDARLKAVELYLNTPPVTVGTRPRDANTVSSPAGVPAVHRQVWQLMSRVTELGKDGQADKSMGGYKFRSIEAAMTAVGHGLREIGLMFVPAEILDKRIERYTTEGHEWKNGTKYAKTLNWTHVWVTQRYYFVSLIDGSKSEPFEMDGEARDNGDKSTSKADSMRMKYALLQALCIPTEGLPESDGRDGTEGADDPWGSAPPVGGNQQQYTDEPPWDTGAAQSAPAGQAAEQAAEDRQDDRPDEVKAAAAVKALNGLSQLPPERRREQFQKIADKVRETGIGSVLVEGVTVNKHLTATNANLGGS